MAKTSKEIAEADRKIFWPEEMKTNLLYEVPVAMYVWKICQMTVKKKKGPTKHVLT